MSNLYEQAGVSLERGYQLVDKIKSDADRTSISGVMSKIGGFASMFDLGKVDVEHPVLVSGCDGVGTKILLCEDNNNYETIGQDLVAMCVNDVIVTGGMPLYFLDYIACGISDVEVLSKIVSSVADGCELAECALIGGETAEMPDCYKPGSYDLAGFCVGVVDKKKIVDGSGVLVGDVVIGMKSSGLHSNGYSLVRKLLFKDNDFSYDYLVGGRRLGDLLLEPTKIYVRDVKLAIDNFDVKAMAHITGGGLVENLPRCLGDYGCEIDLGSLPSLDVYEFLKPLVDVGVEELCNYFNMGVGFTFVVGKADASRFVDMFDDAFVVGRVVDKPGVVFCEL